MINILADESVDSGIIKNLRNKGFIVISISEENSGIKDEEVLNIAFDERCLLITEDKDFGELTNRLKLKHAGILLIRLSEIPRENRIEMVSEIFEKYPDMLINNFSVLSKTGIRIKTVRKR